MCFQRLPVLLLCCVDSFSLLLKDLEIENEDLREKLRKIQQEQRILLDKVNGLQLQLNEVNSLN